MTPTSEPLDDLRNVVRNLKTTHHQKERDPNDPRVVEILESAVDVLGHFYLRSGDRPPAGSEDTADCESTNRKIMTTIFSPVTRQAVISRFNERQSETATSLSLSQLTARNLDSLWSGAAPFQHDVLNYLYRPTVHRIFLAELVATLEQIIDQATFGQALRALGKATVDSPQLETLRIQVLLPVLFSNNTYLRDLSEASFDEHYYTCTYLSETLFTAYGLEFVPGRTARDLHIALDALTKSAFLFNHGARHRFTGDNGVDVHQQLIFDTIRCHLGVPLKEALSLTAPEGRQIMAARLKSGWYEKTRAGKG